MNLLCPNCQKMLNVSDESAGQLMKCPTCEGTFTVPGLPGSAPPAGSPEPDIYSFHPETTPLSPPPATVPAYHSEPPPSTTPASPPPPSLTPQGYSRTFSVRISPRVLPWIAPACLLIVFVLQFFDWVGIYPGGMPSVTQNAWQAAFGGYTEDGDLPQPAMRDDKSRVGASVLTIFYLLPLFFVVLFVTVASVIITRIHVKLPPQVERLIPWRWGIVAALNLILFFFLGLQVILGFSLESHYENWVERTTKNESKEPLGTKERKTREVERGELLLMLRHTVWLRLAILLHLAAILSSVLMFWINQRGTHRPEPKLELAW